MFVYFSAIGNSFLQVKHVTAAASSEYKSSARSCLTSSATLQLPGKEHPQSSVAIEFVDLDIPMNATIQDARITLFAYNASISDNTTIEISVPFPGVSSSDFIPYCQYERIGNQAILEPVVWKLGQWTSGVEYSSPNIAHLIQYLISHSSWSEDSSVLLIIRPSVDSNVPTGSARYAYSHTDSAKKPKLSLNYTSQYPGKNMPQ